MESIGQACVVFPGSHFGSSSKSCSFYIRSRSVQSERLNTMERQRQAPQPRGCKSTSTRASNLLTAPTSQTQRLTRLSLLNRQFSNYLYPSLWDLTNCLSPSNLLTYSSQPYTTLLMEGILVNTALSIWLLFQLSVQQSGC